MKKIAALCIMLLVFLSSGAQLRTNVLVYRSTGLPVNGVKIKTNLPFSPGTQMPTILIQGYAYGIEKTIDLALVYYPFGGTFTKASASSSGGFAPPITLANENGKVSIFIDSKVSWQRFAVHAVAGGFSAETVETTGYSYWSAVDSLLIPAATAVTPVKYENNFTGTVYTPNGSIDSITTTISSNGDAHAYANMTLAAKTTASLPDTAPVLFNFSLRKDGLFSGNTSAPTLELYATRKNGTYIAPFLVMPDGTVVLAGAQNAVNGNVGIGVKDTKGYKLAVGGNIIAEQVVVKLQGDWPDYVFHPGYKLPSLASVEHFIKKEHHLPHMPAGREVKSSGIDLAENQKALVKTVEELTLYVIQLKAEIDALKTTRQ
jgi:hypothetical protein